MIEFNWINNGITFLRILLFSKFFRSKIKPKPDSGEIFILANGPSLTRELDYLTMDFFKTKESLVVNYFVFSEIFESIQPSHYVLSAPDFFYDEPSKDFEANIERLFRGINDRTSWKMTLYVPYLAKKYTNWKKWIHNPKVHIHYYNTAVSEGSYWLVRWMLKKQLGMPRLQNVLIPSLLVGIASGYKTIYLLGVDHSWLRQINVNQENEVLMSHPHFYEKKVETMRVKKGIDDVRTLHEVLHKFYFTFKSYFIIRRYAEECNCKIYNLTEGSYIDAYERMELEKLKNK